MALRVDYDGEADVLYVTREPHVAGGPLAYGVTGRDDITRQFSGDGVPVGALVVGYREAGWPGREGELASRLSRHFGVSLRDVLRVLRAIR